MFFQSAKGIIALDIDGTVTDKASELDSKVIDALERFYHQGWLYIFITGRPYFLGYGSTTAIALFLCTGRPKWSRTSGNALEKSTKT